jgi:ATP-binding protein involved in chromosome partitioning
MPITVESALAALGRVNDPEIHRSIEELGLARDVRVEGDVVDLTLELLTPSASYKQALDVEIRRVLKEAGAKDVRIRPELSIPTRNILSDDPCPAVKNIVLVMSGKGGVGKSTVAANLAVALTRMGAKVGLLDADMYGPSVPTMFGVMGRPTSARRPEVPPARALRGEADEHRLPPRGSSSAVVWRGPMLQNALLQFLRDVDWGDLDYLVLDLPPGTGDIALTISQKVRTTGRDHRDDAAGGRAAGRVQVRLDGPEGGHLVARRGRERELLHLRRLLEAARALRIGRRVRRSPISRARRSSGRSRSIRRPRVGRRGTPVVEAAPESSIGKAFLDVAERLAGRISAHNLGRGDGLRIDRSGGKQRHLPISR